MTPGAGLMSWWRARPPSERRRLQAAALLILVLLGYLAVRQLGAVAARQNEWLQLEQRSRQLLQTQALDSEQWQALGLRHQLTLQDIAQLEQGWRLSGRVAQPRQVEAFLAAALQLGWYPLGWQLQAGGTFNGTANGISNGTAGLEFSVQLVALTPPREG